LKEAPNGELWQQAAYLLMIHGGAAMLTLMLLGALFPVHVAAPGARDMEEDAIELDRRTPKP
jgi:hypothetical protein